MSETAKLPLPDLTGKPKEPDWAWIEHEYRNGAQSLREIARDAGISQPAISKRAKREGWTREVITPVITWADNQPDNQADNRGREPCPVESLPSPPGRGGLTMNTGGPRTPRRTLWRTGRAPNELMREQLCAQRRQP